MRQKLTLKWMKQFWSGRLPNREALIERLAETGLLPTDAQLTPLELVCGCSLMVESKTTFEALEAIAALANESVEAKFDEAFFEQFQSSLDAIHLAGMRAQARKLRKLGLGIATMQREERWQGRWDKENKERLEAAIRDEPFLPQKG
ncbi:MAG: hypothetical protein AB1894_25860 [Chloroflexota bacterium]